MSHFSLKITLGNEAMQTPDDVAAALRQVADRLDGTAFVEHDGAKIRDTNGNTVGLWFSDRENS
jgi:hypothetical protein